MGVSFSANKLKVNLRTAITRLSLNKNKKANFSKSLRRDVAEQLRQGREEAARIKVEQVIREDMTVEAYDILELMCELLCQRIPLIEAEPTCPEDMVEAVSTVIYAANRVQIPELREVQRQLAAKYGVEFAQHHAQNQSGCVNPRVINKLSIQPPELMLVLKYLSDIAKQYNIEYEPHDVAPTPPPAFPAFPPPAAQFPSPPGGYPKNPNGGGGGGDGGDGGEFSFPAPPQGPVMGGPGRAQGGVHVTPGNVTPMDGVPSNGSAGAFDFPSVPSGSPGHAFPSAPGGFPNAPTAPHAGGSDDRLPDLNDLSARFAALKK